MTAMTEAIGIDLGGTKIAAGRVDSKGKLLNSIRWATDATGGPVKIQNDILEAVREIQNSSRVPISGVGIGVAGQIDPVNGVVKFAPNLPGWQNIPLQADMEDALGLPVKVINDVRAITWGEWLFGAGSGAQDLACVFVGTGIGAGIVVNGNMLNGHSNTFAEVGHMTVDLNGPICTCGNFGCWETLAGGWGIAKQAQEAVLNNIPAGTLLLELSEQKIEHISAKIVVDAYHQNDPLAMTIIKKVEKALIAGCINLVNLYNPERLILGGGIIEGIPEMIRLIEAGVSKRALKAATGGLKIVPAKLGKQVGIIGAAAVILDFVFGGRFKTGNAKS